MKNISGGKPMKTYMASPSTIERKWYVVDATGYKRKEQTTVHTTH